MEEEGGREREGGTRKGRDGTEGRRNGGGRDGEREGEGMERGSWYDLAFAVITSRGWTKYQPQWCVLACDAISQARAERVVVVIL